jgi:hypothetical protein
MHGPVHVVRPQQELPKEQPSVHAYVMAAPLPNLTQSLLLATLKVLADQVVDLEPSR